MRFDRAAGVLLHPTSLPGSYGIGDLGPAAFAYLDWLADAKVSWWQVLPLSPVGSGNSPYCARSTFAGNTLLISPETLIEDGQLAPGDLGRFSPLAEDRVDYAAVADFKSALLNVACERRRTAPQPEIEAAFAAFRAAEQFWLDDYTLFAALKEAHGGAAWLDWPAPLSLRDPAALSAWRAAHVAAIEDQAFLQFLWGRQWDRVRAHAWRRGIRILGDLPMFVALDSAEVWAHRNWFRLDARGRPTHVSGVPPDYFNSTGQLWGNPLYDWAALERDGYSLWVERVRRTLKTVDAVRLDHFRGFAAYWEVLAGAPTATAGRWAPGPGRKLFDRLVEQLGSLPFVAEDLGDIDQPVLDLRDAFDLPGMVVLQFAFSPNPRSIFIPYRHRAQLVVYTGTHDNNTASGWCAEDASDAERDFLRRYAGADGREIHWDLVRLALASVADLAVIPHQDLAGAGASARMNTPGRGEGNWTFRLTPPMLDRKIQQRFADLIWVYGRQPEQNQG